MSAPGKAQTKPDTLTPNVAPTGRNPEVRTLKEPPDIWDLVHETRAEFKPGSAFVGHLTSLHPLVLAAILLIIGGGALFWFVKLRGWSAGQTAAAPVQVESSSTNTVSNPQYTPPGSTAPASEQQSNSTPAGTETAASTMEAPSSEQQSNNTPPGTDTAASTTEGPGTAAAAPAASLDKKVPAQPRRQNPASSTTASGTTVAGTRKKDRAQASSLTTAGSASVARTDNQDAGKASTTEPKSDTEKGASPTAAKKADKALSPQLIAPAKAGPTPKAKVIPWP